MGDLHLDDLIVIETKEQHSPINQIKNSLLTPTNQSFDLEQVFKAKDDYIISCDYKRLYVTNLKNNHTNQVNQPVGKLFASNNHICKLRTNGQDEVIFEIARIDALSFTQIGIVKLNV